MRFGRWLAVAVAFSALVVPAHAEAAVLFEGCSDLFIGLRGDEGAIRAAVPDGYRASGELWSITTSCDRISVGGEWRRGSVTVVGAAVEAPEAGAPSDIHAFALWIGTDVPALFEWLNAGGAPAAGARVGFSLEDALATRHARLGVRLPGDRYGISAAVTPVVTPPHAHDAKWWFGDEPGRAALIVRHAFSTENFSDCAVRAKSGGTLARLLGSTSAAALCFLQDGVSATADLRGRG